MSKTEEKDLNTKTQSRKSSKMGKREKEMDDYPSGTATAEDVLDVAVAVKSEKGD